MATESKLWQQINALGGVPSNDYDRGFNDAIRQVLELIEADEAEQLVTILAMLQLLEDEGREFQTSQDAA